MAIAYEFISLEECRPQKVSVIGIETKYLLYLLFSLIFSASFGGVTILKIISNFKIGFTTKKTSAQMRYVPFYL